MTAFNTPRQPAEKALTEFITTNELCRRLQVCRRTVLNHGLTRYAIRLGSQWRFDWRAIVAHYAGDGKQGQ